MRFICLKTGNRIISAIPFRVEAGAGIVLFQAGISEEERKGLRDKIAAAGILQNHLNSIR